MTTLSTCQTLKTDIAAARQALADKRLGNMAVMVQTGPDVPRFANTSVSQIEAQLREWEADYHSLSCAVVLGETATDTIRPARHRGPLAGPVGRR